MVTVQQTTIDFVTSLRAAYAAQAAQQQDMRDAAENERLRILDVVNDIDTILADLEA